MVLTSVAYVTLVLYQSTRLLEEEPQVLHEFFSAWCHIDSAQTA